MQFASVILLLAVAGYVAATPPHLKERQLSSIVSVVTSLVSSIIIGPTSTDTTASTTNTASSSVPTDTSSVSTGSSSAIATTSTSASSTPSGIANVSCFPSYGNQFAMVRGTFMSPEQANIACSKVQCTTPGSDGTPPHFLYLANVTIFDFPALASQSTRPLIINSWNGDTFNNEQLPQSSVTIVYFPPFMIVPLDPYVGSGALCFDDTVNTQAGYLASVQPGTNYN